MECFLIKKVELNVDGVPVKSYLQLVDGRDRWVSNPFHAEPYLNYPDAQHEIQKRLNGGVMYQIEKVFR